MPKPRLTAGQEVRHDNTRVRRILPINARLKTEPRPTTIIEHLFSLLFRIFKRKMTERYTYSTNTSKESRNHVVEIDEETINSKIEYSTEPTLPKSLFKYYSCNRFSLDVLKTEKIWASNPNTFNDPFDCAPQYWDGNNFPYSEIKNILYTLVVPDKVDACKNTNQLKELFFNVIYDFIGLYCLNEGINDDLFWAYYGDDHKGFRIEFSQEKLSKFWLTAPVKLEYIEPTELLNQKMSIEKSISDDFKRIFTKIIRWISIKKAPWLHENEWRYLFWTRPLDSESRLQKYPLSAMESISLGFKFFENSSTQYLNSGISKYTFELKDGCGGKLVDYNFEVLKQLHKHSATALYQVALNEDLTLFEQRIHIKEIDGDTVTIQREFSPEQLAIMDAPL